MAETSRKNSEDDFLRVLEEMNRLCGEDGGSSADARQGDEQADLVAVVIADDDDESNNNVSKIKRRSSDDDDELDGIFASTEAKSTSLASGGLKCDQLLSSAAHSASSASSNSHKKSSRSRHCSDNSTKSYGSFDSAIGDVYSVQTPKTTSTTTATTGKSTGLSKDPLEIFDTSPPPLIKSSCHSSASVTAGQQFDDLAASVCFDSGEPSADLLEFDSSKDVDGLGGISLRLVGSEDVDLLGTSLAMSDNSPLSPASKPSSPSSTASNSKKRPLDTAFSVSDIDYLGSKKKHRISSSASITQRSSQVIIKETAPTSLPPRLQQERLEVEKICLDLLRRFQSACHLHPKTQAKVWMAKSGGVEDPLSITTRLISDSLARLRIFVHSLDPMNWLHWHDSQFLYCNNVCVLSVFKAAVSVNLEAVPMAYPLPYGEYLGEVEALHLILAHDLYNELRALLSDIQSLGIREFPVMLLVMMVAFFTPQPGVKQPEKVMRVNEYYTHKLQVYLHLRYGADTMVNLMTKILSTVERVRSFSHRLREFLNDVTYQSGLQKQFESVCENIGLIAFLLQTEPKYDHC